MRSSTRRGFRFACRPLCSGPARMKKKPETARSPRARREPDATSPARREEVLDAGLSLISELGVAGASLRKLAARLGMSQPSLYHYFDSKDELVRQIIEHCASRMVE